MIAFSLTPEQEKKFFAWREEQNKKAIFLQKTQIKRSNPNYDIYRDSWEAGYPYTGAIGGEISFVITGTSLGYIIKAANSETKETIDLTDYNSF